MNSVPVPGNLQKSQISRVSTPTHLDVHTIQHDIIKTSQLTVRFAVAKKNNICAGGDIVALSRINQHAALSTEAQFGILAELQN